MAIAISVVSCAALTLDVFDDARVIDVLHRHDAGWFRQDADESRANQTEEEHEDAEQEEYYRREKEEFAFHVSLLKLFRSLHLRTKRVRLSAFGKCHSL